MVVLPMSAPLKYCGGCRCEKPHDRFSKNARRSDGLAIQCKDCYRDYHKARMEDEAYRAKKLENKQRWYAANKDTAKEAWRGKAAEWKKANPARQSAYYSRRKAAKLSCEDSFTHEDVLHRLKWQKNKCAICRSKLTNGYHVDHINPLSRGGSNGARNIQILCQSCNCSKHAKDPIDYMRSLGFML